MYRIKFLESLSRSELELTQILTISHNYAINIPKSFFCSISSQLITLPATAYDGCQYDAFNLLEVLIKKSERGNIIFSADLANKMKNFFLMIEKKDWVILHDGEHEEALAFIQEKQDGFNNIDEKCSELLRIYYNSPNDICRKSGIQLMGFGGLPKEFLIPIEEEEKGEPLAIDIEGIRVNLPELELQITAPIERFSQFSHFRGISQRFLKITLPMVINIGLDTAINIMGAEAFIRNGHQGHYAISSGLAAGISTVMWWLIGARWGTFVPLVNWIKETQPEPISATIKKSLFWGTFISIAMPAFIPLYSFPGFLILKPETFKHFEFDALVGYGIFILGVVGIVGCGAIYFCVQEAITMFRIIPELAAPQPPQPEPQQNEAENENEAAENTYPCLVM